MSLSLRPLFWLSNMIVMKLVNALFDESLDLSELLKFIEDILRLWLCLPRCVSLYSVCAQQISLFIVWLRWSCFVSSSSSSSKKRWVGLLV